MNDSENLKNDDQLLTMMEEMQDQIEGLEKELQDQTEINSKVQKKISELSSENLTLKSEVQKRSETIISQNEKIEKMSESDLVLKQNEKLEKENTRLQNLVNKTKEEAEAKVEAVKEKTQADITDVRQGYANRETTLSKREESVIQREKAVSFKEINIDAEITKRAFVLIQAESEALENAAENRRKKLEESYRIKNQKLQRKYTDMTVGYKGMVFFTLFYSIISTIITAWKTETIGIDFSAFIKAIVEAIKTVFECSMVAGSLVAKLGDMIPNEMVANVVHWVLVAIVCAGIVGGIGMTVFVAGKKYVEFFKEKQWDEISVFAGLLILIMIVFMGNFIKSILSVNLFLAAIIMFVGYTVIRGIIQAENKEVKRGILKYSAIAVGGIGVFVVMVHFFGVIGFIAVPIGCLLAMSGN